MVNLHQTIFPPGTVITVHAPSAVQADRVSGNQPREAARVAAISAGAAAVAAAVTVNPAGANNAIVYTAKTAGAAGNQITVAYVVGGADQALDVDVDGTAITVTLKTASSVVQSTGDEVKDAIAAHAEANALVAATDAAANDGSGVVTAMAAAPLAGGSDALATTEALIAADATLTVDVPAGHYVAAGAVGGRYRYFEFFVDA